MSRREIACSVPHPGAGKEQDRSLDAFSKVPKRLRKYWVDHAWRGVQRSTATVVFLIGQASQGATSGA
jgi:hypothetical protein